MLRITAIDGPEGCRTLRLDGRLNEHTLDALASAAEAAFGKGGGVVLDLAGVRFASAAGAAALLELQARGAVLLGCSPFIGELLKEIPT